MLNTAKNIIKEITKRGFDALIVGGCIRDILMKQTPHDLDLATNMPLEMIENIWPSHDIGQSKDFGILCIIVNNNIFEIAQFRAETGYTDHRRPDQVVNVDSFQEDAARRDFTMNAMAMDFLGNIFDFFGGKQDIENKILRTVGNPETRFNEDFLRMIRACRFAACFDFVIEKTTKKAIKKLAHKIVGVSPERIRMEIIKVASDGESLARFIKLLDETRLIKFILPEIEALKWINNPIQHHPEGRSVFSHIIECLKVSKSIDPIHNIAILLHDVGKLTTRGVKEGSIPTFHGHDKAGIPIIDDLLSRLKFTNDEKEAIIFSSSQHMRFHLILDMKKSKVVRLINSKHWDVLVSVGFADNMCRKNISSTIFDETMTCVSQIRKQHESQKEIVSQVNGKQIMQLTGLKPGKIIGKIKQVVSDWIIDNEVDDQVEIDQKILEVREENNV